MQTVYDVLENQARSALLPDAIISTILSQLQVKVTYEPLNCENLLLTLADQAQLDANKGYCIIADNIVTGICTVTANMMCTPPNPAVTITSVPVNHTLISGTLMTTNIIMANWSRAMWQNVVNRAVRMFGIESTWTAVLFSIRHCRRKLKVMMSLRQLIFL
ncbi:hypothetical protein KIN20_014158 [Parelaphostrongylus tenuis]|uniref:Uncharacterized protein n=1 Tax=Parelaphostrongylus tenuis TaxID=148309 RepID=A0AAD5MEJ3_PARTN|nr:hypothetical protein KIN20_014158 [Parelaphostrongylus tenuis]